MTNGIATALHNLAHDESPQTALHTAEQWRNTLEAMAEVANSEQRQAIVTLIGPLHIAIQVLADLTGACDDYDRHKRRNLHSHS